MFSLFFQFEIQKIVRFFRVKRSAKIVTSLLFSLVLLFVATAVYHFFVSALRYIDFSIDADLRLPLDLFLYEVFLLLISLLIVLGTLISGIFLLFKGKNDAWFVSSPQSLLFPHLILIKSTLTSFWALLVLFLPLILAFNHVYSLPFISLLLILLSVFILHASLSTMTLSGVILLGFSYLSLSKKGYLPSFSFGKFILMLGILSTILLTFLWKAVKNVDIVSIFKAEDADHVVSLGDIGSHFSLLPSHTVARLLLSLQTGTNIISLLSFASLILFFIIIALLWYRLSPYYYPLWQRIQEGDRKAYCSKSWGKNFSYHFTGSQGMALFKKELLVFTRNKKGVIWLLFLLVLWLGQIGAHSIVARNIARYAGDIQTQQSLLQGMEFVIALYFIAAFTLRFVFPSFSAEKKILWILGTAPLDFKKLFFGKYFFYLVFFSLLGFLMQSLSMSALAVPLASLPLLLTLFLISVIFIVTLGLSMGALFPSFESDDPEVISTSLPGLSFTLLSLCFASLSSALLYLSLLGKLNAIVLPFFFVATLATALYLLVYTLKKTKNGIQI